MSNRQFDEFLDSLAKQGYEYGDGTPIERDVIEHRAELAALCARVAELEAQAATLTPRRCSRECYLRGWQAAQEAAAFECESQSRRYTNLSEIAALDCAKAIRALQPPADCGDCNPLKPSEHDADMLDEWHKRM